MISFNKWRGATLRVHSILFAMVLSVSAAEPAIVTRSNPQQYLFRFEMEVENRSGIQQVFSVIMPHSPSDNYQDVEYRTLSGEIVPMVDGKGTFIDTLVVLGPKESKTLVNEFVVTVYDADTDFGKIKRLYSYDKKSQIYKLYTGSELPYVDPENARVKELYDALSEKAKDDLEFAGLAYDHVVKKVSNYRAGHHSLDMVLVKKSGSCVDKSGLFISLLRRRGMPARFLTGYTLRGGTHARSEFYLEKYGWIPADIGLDTYESENRLFGRSISDAFASVVTQVNSGHVYLPSDEFGFVTTRPFTGMVPEKAYAGKNVAVKRNKATLVKLEDGKPVGKLITL